MLKKGIAVIIVGGVLAAAFASVAYAQSSTSTKSLIPKGLAYKLEIGPKGNAHLRGTVSAVASGSIVVKSWGGEWIVLTNAETKVGGRKGKATLGDVKVGDFVAVNGQVSETAALTITARSVMDYSLVVKAVKDEVKKQIEGRIKQKYEEKKGDRD